MLQWMLASGLDKHHKRDSQGCPTPAEPEFIIELTKEAALKKYLILKRKYYKLDFQKAI